MQKMMCQSTGTLLTICHYTGTVRFSIGTFYRRNLRTRETDHESMTQYQKKRILGTSRHFQFPSSCLALKSWIEFSISLTSQRRGCAPSPWAAVARRAWRPGGNCIKIGLPEKSILKDYFQENRTSRRPFLLPRISFPGRPVFVPFPPDFIGQWAQTDQWNNSNCHWGHYVCPWRICTGPE